eukprot:TCONS_00055461-protein
MSDNESDDEFLSADEGEYEDGKGKTSIDEDEVDEIMDLLMNKEQISNKNESLLSANPTAKKKNSSINETTTNSIKKQEEPSNDQITKDENKKLKIGEENQEIKSAESNELRKKFMPENERPLEVSSDKDENETEEPPLESLEDMIEESLKDESKTNTENQIEDTKENHDQLIEQNEVEVDNQESPIIMEVLSENNKEIESLEIVDENQAGQQESSKEETKPKQPNELSSLKSNVKVTTDSDTIEKNEDSTSSDKNVKEIPVVKSETSIENEVENTRHDLDDLDLDDDSDEEENLNKPCENVSENVTEEVQEQPVAQDLPVKEVENECNESTTENVLNEDTPTIPESETKECTESQTNDSCDSGISVANDDIPNLEKNKQLSGEDETESSTPTSEDKPCTPENDSETQEETEPEGVDSFDEGNEWGDWGNEEIEVENKSVNQNNEKSSKSVSEKPQTQPEPPKQTQQSQAASQPHGDWGWDSWADDFLIQAAGKVSNMLESVEDQLGIPDPTKMAHVVSKEERLSPKHSPAHKNKDKVKSVEVPKTKEEPPVPQQQQQQQQTPAAPTGGSSWFGGFGASLSGLVQNTSTDLVTGGIGALEFIGKKTVDMLSDGDPGLRQARDTIAGKKKTNLSALLQEAKETSEKNPSTRAKTSDEMNFNDYFEKFQGNINLDALEMLSNECDNKLERILRLQSHEAKQETEEVLAETQEKFSLPEDIEESQFNSDFKKDLFATTKQLKMKVTCSKLLNTWTKLKEKSKNTATEPKECFNNTISGLAELTSKCVEFYRKVADMFLATDMQARDLALQRASALQSISVMFLIELTQLTNNFAQQIADNVDPQKIVTDIYLEGSNCSSIVRDCHDLVLPILQCCIVK